MGYGGSYGNLSSGSGEGSVKFPYLLGLTQMAAYDDAGVMGAAGTPVVGAKLLAFIVIDTSVSVSSAPADFTLVDSRTQADGKFYVYEHTVDGSDTVDSEWTWSFSGSTNFGGFLLQVANCGTLDSYLGSGATSMAVNTPAMTATNEGSFQAAIARSANQEPSPGTSAVHATLYSMTNENSVQFSMQTAVVPAGATPLLGYALTGSSLWHKMGYLFNPEGV